MAKLTEAKIQELKTQFADLVCVKSPAGSELVFRKPKRLEFDQWFDNRDKGTTAALSLARQCLVYPSAEEFMAELEACPFLLMCKSGVVDSITDLAGADGEVSSKKL
jgi:hypothetical protein